MSRDKIYALIYSQYIGDAVGTRYEFKSSKRATEQISKDMRDGFLPILGGGPFKLLPGACTDDTELSSVIFRSLLEKGTYDREDVAKRYIGWLASSPFDIGNTTIRALSQAKDYTTMVQNSAEQNMHSLSNGCLMRISPLAIYGLTVSDDHYLNIARENCRMTNPNELTQDAVAVYCTALKAALQGKTKREIFDAACKVATNPTIREILQDSLKRPEPVLTPSGDHVKTDSSNMGYCGIAIQNAFYELMNGTSFYESVVNIVKRGGDTDTVGAISSALLGVFYGFDAIPKKWVESVTMDNPRVKDYPEIDQLNLYADVAKLIEKLKL